MTVTKNSISDAAGVLVLPSDIIHIFVLINVLTFHAYKKTLPLFLFYFFWRLEAFAIFFSEKLIKKNFKVSRSFLHQQTSFFTDI